MSLLVLEVAPVGITPVEVSHRLSYRLCYHDFMAQREKRSISMPPELARAVEEAARAEGLTFSAWLAQTAARRIKLDAGRRAIAEWEAENGAFTPEELAKGWIRARRSLGRPVPGESSDEQEG
jgi:hypothetical protein